MAHQILVPPLGQTTDTVVFSAWYKQVGDKVKQGEPLFAIETDKATLDIEAQASGVLVQANAAPGENVAALSEIGVITADGEVLAADETQGREATKTRQKDDGITPAPVLQRLVPVGLAKQNRQGRIFISPRARKLAELDGVRWEQLSGTGPEGAIVERDVRSYLAKAAQQIAPSTAMAALPTGLPAWAGQLQSLSAEVDVSALVTVCERLNIHGMRVAAENLLLFVLAQALRVQTISHNQSAATGVAIILATPQGLTTAVISDATQLHLAELTLRLEQLKERARTGTLDSADLSGASISFLNQGVFRIDTSVISNNPPALPVLGVGRIHQGSNRDSMWVSLSYQLGSIDDLAALRLMEWVVRLIEEPDLLL